MRESRYNTWVHLDGAHYVHNGITGALLHVSDSDHQALGRFVLNKGDGDCPLPLLLKLANGRMLVADDLDEVGLLRERFAKGRADTRNLYLTVLPSLGCNFGCPYCFEVKHPSLMSDQVQSALLQYVDDKLPELESLRVCWFGGEPLLGKRALLALSDGFLERCHQAGVPYSAEIFTNGYLLDESTCRQLRDREVISADVTLDGPPEVHDRMRPLVGGEGSFWRIMENLHHAVGYLKVTVRMNVSRDNRDHTAHLLQILADQGLAGKLTVYPGQLRAYGEVASRAEWAGRCFDDREFAEVQEEFTRLAVGYGFATWSLPEPCAVHCTAERVGDLVVGSEGELYKCTETVGDPGEVIGQIRDHRSLDGRLRKWLEYDPFADAECRVCVALPVCIGGCIRRAGGPAPIQHADRCDGFRQIYRERTLRCAQAAEAASRAST